MYPSLIVSLGNPDFDLEADIVKSLPPTSTTWAKAQYYIPSLYWIPNYTLSLYGILNYSHSHVSLSLLLYANRLGGDLTAGLTVAAMLIPQSVSYATSLAKMSPVTGLVSQELVHYVRKTATPKSSCFYHELPCSSELSLTVFCINTPNCIRTPWFLQTVERCTGGCPQSTRWPDHHVRITIRSPHHTNKPRSCRSCSRHSINSASRYMYSMVVLLLIPVILGRVDFLYLGVFSPRFHRRCPVSRTPSRIRHGGCIHYTHVGAPNCSRGLPDSRS